MRVWNWIVYPQDMQQAMIATGVSDSEEHGRKVVEAILGMCDDPAYALMIHPGGFHDVCRRNRKGEWTWRALFDDPVYRRTLCNAARDGEVS